LPKQEQRKQSRALQQKKKKSCAPKKKTPASKRKALPKQRAEPPTSNKAAPPPPQIASPKAIPNTAPTKQGLSRLIKKSFVKTESRAAELKKKRAFSKRRDSPKKNAELSV
jgi:hypothetical protein